MNKQEKKARTRTKNDFLLTLFPDKEKTYMEYELNGFVLVRQHNSDSDEWQVAIFTKDSFNNYKGLSDDVELPGLPSI